MTGLLYYSYSSKLTKAEKLTIDKEVNENRVAVINFFKKVYSKRKVIVISTTLGILILVSTPKNVESIGVRVPVTPPNSIMRQFTESVPTYARLIVEKQDKVTFLKNEKVYQSDKIYSGLSENRISTVDEILELRGGEINPLIKILFRLIFLWSMSQNHTPTEAFQLGQINPGFGNLNPTAPAFRIAPKLQENPVDRNNLGQGNCRSSNYPSMDKLANSLSPEYSEFQSKYYSESLPKRFDTNEYSARKFKELAKDPRVDGVKYDRVSIDEARAIVQAKLQTLVIKPTRPDMETARRVDLDFKVQGPAPFTHFDVKNPVGSEILKKQGQTISLGDMAYKIGQNIVNQKHRFVGLENGPVSSENVGHIVDLCYVPSSEKAIVKQKVLQGAVEKGSDAGIVFLNDI